jgi:hypothetical protein
MQSNVGPSPAYMNRWSSSAYRGKAESDADIAARPLIDPKATSAAQVCRDAQDSCAPTPLDHGVLSLLIGPDSLVPTTTAPIGVGS